MMKRAVDLRMSRILKDCKTKSYELWIEDWTGNKNIFRNSISKSGPYKHRRPTKCPLMKEAKEYMVSAWNASVTLYLEAEDMCIIGAYKHGVNKSIVACIDKDLLCHALEFYNYGENVLGGGLGIAIPPRTKYLVSHTEATLHFYRQLLTGDPTDSIPGIRGIGKKRAIALITDPLTAQEDAIKVYKKHKHGYNYFIEQFNLLYIRSTGSTDTFYPITKGFYDTV